MKFTDDPNFDLSFTEYGRQEVFDLIEGTNPPGSVLILSVDDEIADRPGFSWDIEAHFMWWRPQLKEGGKSQAVFEISWDDNYGFGSGQLNGVQGALDQTVDLLINEYWKSLNLDEDDPWAEVLQPFRERAAQIISQVVGWIHIERLRDGSRDI